MVRRSAVIALVAAGCYRPVVGARPDPRRELERDRGRSEHHPRPPHDRLHLGSRGRAGPRRHLHRNAGHHGRRVHRLPAHRDQLGEARQSPEISADGNTIYFTSDRGGNLDVYITTRSGGSWSVPQPVPELNSSASESDVALSPDGLTALVARTSGIYLATRSSTIAAFGTPVLAAVLDVTGDVAAPSLTDGAATVYLHGGATRDLYVAYRQAATFTTPVPITELDTAARDASPFISADGTRLLFERAGELYESTR